MKSKIPPSNPALFAAGLFGIYLLAAILLYWPVVNGGFQVDDWWWCENARMYGLLGNDHSHGTGALMFYRPGVSVAFGTVWALFGPVPAAFRVLSLALLASCGCALYSLWLRLISSRSRFEALLAGAVFVAWPTHVEATAWIAAMTDGLSLGLGAWSVWAYISYIQEHKRWQVWVSGILLFLALLTKESAIALPPICLILAVPAARRTKSTAWRWGAVASLVIPTLLYLGMRWHAIGQLVGGYPGRENPNSFVAGLSGSDMVVNLANAYLPFGKWIALWADFIAVKLALKLLALGAAILLATIYRRPRISSRRTRLAAFLLLCAGTIWALILLLPLGRLTMLHQVFATHLLAWPATLAIVVGVAHLIRRDLVTLEGFIDRCLLPGRSVWLPILPFVLAAWILYQGVFAWQELLVFAAAAWIAFVAGGSGQQGVEPRNGGSTAIVAAAFAASVVALLPVVTLPISMDGQQSRFSYMATFFGVFALCAVVTRIAGETRRSRIALSAVLVASAVLLVPNVLGWSQAGDVSRETAAEIKSLLPAKHIFVLVAPGTLNGAVLFLGGIDRIPSVTAGDRTSRVGAAFTILNMDARDRLFVRPMGPATFQIGMRPHEGRRLHNPTLIFSNDGSMFTIDRGRGLVHLNGFAKGDHVLFVDAAGPHIVL